MSLWGDEDSVLLEFYNMSVGNLCQMFGRMIQYNTSQYFKMSGTPYTMTDCCIPEELNFQQYCCENLIVCNGIISDKFNIRIYYRIK
jgi:hypothetical protein